MIDRFVFIVGAMKCGTTALFKSLVQHPQVCGCREKEPNYFTRAETYEGGFAAYQALYPWEEKEHAVALEASTAYTKLPMLPSGAPHIYSHRLEDARFVYVVRDPVERIRSEYLHSLAAGWGQDPITEGLDPATVALSNYAFQILPYEYFFGRERILVLGYDEYRTATDALLRRVCEFIGVDPTFQFEDTGPRNSSTDYLRRLFLRLVERDGVLSAPLDPEDFRALSFEQLLAHCRGLAERPEQRDRLRELAWEMRRSYTLSREQAGLVRDVLEEDLARFTAVWGVDPWTSG